MSPDRFPFEGLSSPSVPEGLRERVLSAARGKTAAPTPGLFDRLWESRRARLAAAAVLFALLILNLAVPPRSSRRVDRPASGGAEAAYLVDGIRLPSPGETSAAQWEELAPELKAVGYGAGDAGGGG